jgi:hypothetical protein
MADPVTLGVVGMGASALGGAVNAFGNWFGGETKGAMYDYQAGIAQMNATVDRQNAAYAEYAGEVKAQQSGMKARFQIGQARADQGASGLDVNSGSATQVREGMYKVAQQDMSTIRSNAAKIAYGYNVDAAAKDAESTLDKYAASTSRTAGDIAAVGSLLGGAGSVASKWQGGGSAGLWGGGSGSDYAGY